MRIRLAFYALLFFLFAGPPALAQGIQANHARIELLSDASAVTPGTDFTLGVHFVLEPGWHIYWVNPGDSGQPPVLTWQLPPGFRTGEIQWPRPERIESSSQLADYGYHDDVLLMVPVHVPLAVPIKTVEFALQAKWLICREVCFADRAQLHLSLPPGAGAPDLATAPLFAGARKLLPKPLPPGWKTTAESRKDDFVVSVKTGKPIAKAEFFPLEPAQLDNAAAQKVRPTARGVEITLKKSELLLKPVAVLRGVLVLAGGDAYHVEAPVTAAKGIK